MIFINFFYCLDELCGIGNIAYYGLYPCDIITLIEASSYSVNQPAIRCKLPAYSFSDSGRRPGYNCFVHLIAATQNVFKYTQTHREIKVLADTSYCFDVYALAIVNNTLLTSSCTLHSRKFLR